MFRTIVVAVFILASARSVWAFDLLFMPPIPARSLTFHINLPGETFDGFSYSELFREAVLEWETATGFLDLNVVEEVREKCNRVIGTSGTQRYGDDEVSIVSFLDNDECGVRFEEDDVISAIGIAWTTLPTHIAFYGEYEWTSSVFLSTAIHEIGHTLGLGHGAVEFSHMSYEARADQEAITPDDVCGLIILYEIDQECVLDLGQGATASGSETSARFFGGATSTAGVTFDTQFSPDEEIQIYASVIPEIPQIAPFSSRLHVIAIDDEGNTFEIENSNEVIPYTISDLRRLPITQSFELFPVDFKIAGTYREDMDYNLASCPWVSVEGRPGLPRRDCGLEHRTMDYFTGRMLGMEGRSMDFYIGYSLSTEPGEVYFGANPISISWSD